MIAFILNNDLISTKVNAGITLLDFIREHQQLKGTKIGCREGDCGACTVLAGALQKDKSVIYKSITSCISPLGNSHGKHIVTIEGTNLINELTITQKSMVDNHASQCGFCTPGFVVSLTGLALENKPISYNDGLNAISGNICRCTGYKSIERSIKNIVDMLKNKNSKDEIKWLIDKKFIPPYFIDISDKLDAIKAKGKDKPAKYVAGGTDLYVRYADLLADEKVSLLSSTNELSGISFYKNNCVIGASTSISDLMNNNAMQVYFPKIQSYLKLVASEQIRNMATIAGNLVNASPIGDMTILFLALNSKITIQNIEGKLRTIRLKDFYKSYKKIDLLEQEIITNISFEVPNKTHLFNFEKVSKRTHLDIASVNAAICLRSDGNILEDVHLSLGGVAPIPKYLHKTSKFLNGKEINHETIIEANIILQQEIHPISDVRGSDHYKRLLARQLFFAHFVTLFPNKIDLNKLANS